MREFRCMIPPGSSLEGIELTEGVLYAQAVDAVAETVSDGRPYRVQLMPIEFKPIEFHGMQCDQMILTIQIQEIAE